METQNSEKLIISLLQDKKTRHRAFEEIVSKYQRQLYWQIRRMVLSHDDANDILQNTFLKAWQSIDGFRGDSKISTWLFRICTNETLSFLERQRNLCTSIDEADGSTDNLTSDNYFNGDEIQKKLQNAIASLPDKQKLVFNMKYFNEMKYEEMSEILKTSTGALKASYHIAVEKIKKYFEDND